MMMFNDDDGGDGYHLLGGINDILSLKYKYDYFQSFLGLDDIYHRLLDHHSDRQNNQWVVRLKCGLEMRCHHYDFDFDFDFDFDCDH